MRLLWCDGLDWSRLLLTESRGAGQQVAQEGQARHLNSGVSSSKDYSHLYNTAAWKRLREAQLNMEPLCCFCLEVGKTTEAKPVDHIVPHRGDPSLFYDPANLQSLCPPCHDTLKRQIESRGYHDRIGLDGFPSDPRHPFNQR